MLVAAGVLATVLRQAVLGISIYWPAVKRRLDLLEARAHLEVARKHSLSSPNIPTKGRRFAGDLASSFTASLVLSGILETRLIWFGVFTTFLIVRLLRSGLIVVQPLEAWKLRARAIPVVARIAALWLLATVGRSVLSEGFIGSYGRMSVIVAIGVVISLVVFPGEPRRPSEPVAGPVAEPV